MDEDDIPLAASSHPITPGSSSSSGTGAGLGRSQTITPSLSGSRPTTPHSRLAAVEQLRRAASLRENGSKGTGSTDGGGSPISPRVNVARMGLERSASDAARRIAMAKLTGEKIEVPPEYTSPKTPLPAGPLPSLAELQARHEQRLAMTSPSPTTRHDHAPTSSGLQRSASSLSHSGSADPYSSNTSVGDAHEGSSQGHSSALSRSQSTRRDPSDTAVAGEGHAADDEQRRTEERQEARTNLIRKLSRGRLAAGAAPAARDRAGAASPGAGPGTPASPATDSRPSSPAAVTTGAPLQRRPSLAEVLAKAEARRAAQAQAESPSKTTVAGQRSNFPQSSAVLPAMAAEDATPAKGLYDHIPIPPTPESSDLSSSRYDTLKSVAGTGHESVYSAASDFRPYRHTMERDRDSHMARLQHEDSFDLELASGASPGGSRAHAGLSPASEVVLGQFTPASAVSSTPPSLPAKENKGIEGTFLSPPDSPLGGAMIPERTGPQQHQQQSLLRSAVAAMVEDSPGASTIPGLPPYRTAESLPESPDTESPTSALKFSPLAIMTQHRNLTSARTGGNVHPLHEQAEASGVLPSSLPEAAGSHASPFNFLQHRTHQANPSTDSFPVSVAGSHASRHPQSMAFSAAAHSISQPIPEDGLPSAYDIPKQHPPLPPPIRTERSLPGPSAEYRFPTPITNTRPDHSRPSSLVSVEKLDESMDKMIHHLETLQAADGRAGSEKYKPASNPLERFAAQAQEDNKQMRAHPMQAQTSASALHDFHATHEPALPVPHELPRHAYKGSHQHTKSTTSDTPSHRREGSGVAKPSQPVMAVVGAHARLPSEAAAETLIFPAHGHDVHSEDSGLGDSAPSLVQTSSSSSSTSSDPIDYMNRSPPRNHAKEQVMQRLSDLLSSYSQPKQPTRLNVPPRQLLLHSPVLQVVNANTVKDRYLFLFTDILVIAKPIVEESNSGEPIPPTLDTRFLVKSIVELPKLKLSAQAAEASDDSVQKRKHPLLLTFVDRFANDPKKSIAALIAKAGLPNDASTIANLLFRNPELNRSQLGTYLSSREQKHVLKAYWERFRMAGVRIEDALRVFLGSLRLPHDYSAAEYLLSVFSSQWLASNPGTGMTNDSVFATKLVISMMELNDALHSGINDETAAAGSLFSFPNPAITVDDFIAAFRLKDPHGALPDEQLTRIYLAVRKDRLQQAADNSIASVAPEIETVMHPAKLPNRLTYRCASENISITLPTTDSKFSIKLVGQDLRFEPPLLTFTRSRTATFRVTPTALGSKAVVFIKLGANANCYRNLPINKTFSVERAFMSHTFQIAFVNHLGVKRKYLFSMASPETKFSWVDTLRQRIENSPIDQPSVPRGTRVADAVALQVLRDALITPDEPAPILLNKPLAGGPQFRSHTPPSRAGVKSSGGLQRSNSFSKTYSHGAGKAETDLNERRPSGGHPVAGLVALASLGTNNGTPRGSRDDTPVLRNKSGHELVTMVQQNSLLPLVLGFVSAGAGVDAMPRQPVLPTPALAQATPPHARGTGRFRNL